MVMSFWMAEEGNIFSMKSAESSLRLKLAFPNESTGAEEHDVSRLRACTCR